MLLGITGTNGAGKGTVVDYLVEKKGFTHFSVRQEIVAELTRRGMPIDRPNIGALATQLRTEHGGGYFSKLFMTRAKEQGLENVVIDSIRTVAEAEVLHELGGRLITVDADREIRYERAVVRASETDRVSFEEFCSQEDAELYSSDPSNPAKMAMGKVMEMADMRIFNNGSREELYAQIEQALALS